MEIRPAAKNDYCRLMALIRRALFIEIMAKIGYNIIRNNLGGEDMAKDYSVQGTTKLQREKYVNDAIALSTLDAPEPSNETMNLMRDYVDGKCEITEVLKHTIDRYKVSNA